MNDVQKLVLALREHGPITSSEIRRLGVSSPGSLLGKLRADGAVTYRTVKRGRKSAKGWHLTW